MEAIIIPKNEFASLLRDSDKLYRLECGGVDNWEWYGESLNDNDEDPSYEEIQDMSDDDLIDFYGYEAIRI